MARQIARLNALAVSKLKKPGMYADGAGLYLQVSAAGTKSWIFRFTMNDRKREMGLGPLLDVSLAEAREKAHQCRNQKRDGTDPIEARKSARQQAQLEAARAIPFKDAVEAHGPSWRNDKHGDQWRNTLAANAYPVFGTIAVGDVDVGLVMRVIEPIWTTKIETASRLRGRIEKVLDWATARGYRQGENPARWRGHLEKLLPERSKIRNVNHHPALPFAEIGAFMNSLRAQEGMAARALEFLILTAVRTKEVIGAAWTEIDLDEGVWSIPADRMKANRPHRVPLAPAVLAILTKMKKARVNDCVFPGRGKKPMSNMAMLALLKRMERADLTAHGFRFTFRDWVAEKTDYPGELADTALAHTFPFPLQRSPAVSEQRFVTYYRVSTDRQGRSGLGLDAQREAVSQFLAARSATVIAEFVEVESGGKDDRSNLLEALEVCQRTRAMLLIAKLDRLARSVSFVAGLMDGGVDFVAVDMPHASRFVLHIMAAVAEHERQIIGERTKAALAAAKARGVRLGAHGVILAERHKAAAYASQIASAFLAARQAGAVTARQIADYLNATGTPSRQGRVLRRLAQ